jgi:hypothetical protein
MKEYPQATDAQVPKLLKMEAQADHELSDAASEWANWDRFRKLRVRARRPLQKSR